MSATSTQRIKRRRRRNISELETTWWGPLWTDPSLSRFLSLSLSLSFSLARFLSCSDRFIKRQGSKRVPSSLLSSSPSFSSSSTDSLSSLLLSCSLLFPWPKPIFWALRENKRNVGWGRWWVREGWDRSGGDKFLFSVSVACFKYSLLLAQLQTCHFLSLFHTKSCLLLSSFEQSVYFHQTSEFIFCRKIKTLCHYQWVYPDKCYFSIYLADALCCIQSLWLVRKDSQR